MSRADIFARACNCIDSSRSNQLAAGRCQESVGEHLRSAVHAQSRPSKKTSQSCRQEPCSRRNSSDDRPQIGGRLRRNRKHPGRPRSQHLENDWIPQQVSGGTRGQGSGRAINQTDRRQAGLCSNDRELFEISSQLFDISRQSVVHAAVALLYHTKDRPFPPYSVADEEWPTFPTEDGVTAGPRILRFDFDEALTHKHNTDAIDGVVGCLDDNRDSWPVSEGIAILARGATCQVLQRYDQEVHYQFSNEYQAGPGAAHDKDIVPCDKPTSFADVRKLDWWRRHPDNKGKAPSPKRDRSPDPPSFSGWHQIDGLDDQPLRDQDQTGQSSSTRKLKPLSLRTGIRLATEAGSSSYSVP